MDTSQVYSSQPGASRSFSKEPGLANSPADDVITEDTPNYGFRALNNVFIHNQGSWIVQVGQHTLLADDTLTIINPKNGRPLVDHLQIRFLLPQALAQPIAAYPQLYNGKRLFISYIPAAPID